MTRPRPALLFLLAALALGLALPVAAADEAVGAEPPAWFAEHMEYMTRGSGRWIADNSAYKSEGEPFEAYGIEWTYGIGERGLEGRLFGLRDGKEVATFWELRELWHPGEGQVHLYQFGGNGAVGIGTARLVTADPAIETESDQRFYSPGAPPSRTGHRAIEHPDGRHETRSFDIGEDGTWTPRRTYIWHRDG